MKDYQTANARLSNPYKKWIKEWFKDAAISLTLVGIFIYLLT
jgi:hypothetical protein